jgi:hypothetical protein
MRTTLAIDDDVLQAARRLARRRGMTLGQTISELARQSLRKEEPEVVRNGIPLLRSRPVGVKIDLELVNRLRDEE